MSGSELMTNILEIVASWLLNGQKPELDASNLELVTQGFGYLVADAGHSHNAYMMCTENLAAACLLNWLDCDDDKEHSLRAHLDRQLANPKRTTAGLAFEDSFVWMLWRTFSTGARLDSVFDFCYLPPEWATEEARLVAVFAPDKGGALELVRPDLTTRLAWSTDSFDETMNWFKLRSSPSVRVPFLKPDNNMGPDILFLLRLKNGQLLLVLVQCKCWSKKHSAKDIEKAVFKLSLEGLYCAENVRCFINAICQLLILHAIAYTESGSADTVRDPRGTEGLQTSDGHGCDSTLR